MLRRRSSSNLIGIKRLQSAKMEREEWVALQTAIGDSQNFLGLLSALNWEQGLTSSTITLIESKLVVKKPASLDQALLVATTPSSGKGKKISAPVARHAAESAGILCSFAIAIVEYSYTLQPAMEASDKVERYVLC